MVKRETSFTSQCTPQEIMSKIEEACGPLGFNVRKQNYKVCSILDGYVLTSLLYVGFC